ncbi:hypothetical protein [Variovorax ginsengisoli]|uniref:Uncharacterized protein n=1 Tax=Variovorax ginsengisoli TaxID=363844 RepID=A0ABT9S902_9BURK|nr:hypothetical protein [Variovorax ginsengisoli]MDP9900831.1 hypothetical protein [Variovorax ginsengisoli]
MPFVPPFGSFGYIQLRFDSFLVSHGQRRIRSSFVMRVKLDSIPMSPISENDLWVETEPGFGWQSLRDLALSVLVVAAISLIVSFLVRTS